MNERYERSHCRSCGNSNLNIAAEEDAIQEAVEARERMENAFSNPVCIQTEKIYDACRDRDCVTDERVYFTACVQELIEDAINVKPKSAEIIWINCDVEKIPFNRGYFAVDLKFFILINFDVYTGISCPTEVKGLATFDKRVILFGSEGNARSFESTGDGVCRGVTKSTNNLPKAVVTTVDPIVLSAKLVDNECCDCDCCQNENIFKSDAEVSKIICNCFDNAPLIESNARKVLVSVGLFSIVKLVRPVQLLVNAVDFCIPKKECVSSTDNEPCELFDEIRFPIDEFFPPATANNFANADGGCFCGCDK